MNNSSSIRQRFINFFKQQAHQHVAASPIVNKEDPNLLFTNSGMNQFKDIFLGQKKPTYTRAVNSQPCLRISGKHNDLEEVGIDTYHHTMFEMLGNWSFGDYFKEESIEWAWQLLTAVYKLPKEKLYVTVFEGDVEDNLAADQESFNIWSKYINPERILYGNKKDNFWEMGDVGPCGPCTEIHVDIRPEKEVVKQPGKELVNKGHPQVIEIWNLVFIQYERTSNRKLNPLKNKYVDTGMGFERLAMVLQRKTSTYDTDIFLPLTHNLMYMSNKVYGKDKQTDIAIRVIADHMRAITFAIADGQLPSNTQAGYVIRRILRRAVRYGYTSLGFQQPFMYQLVAILAQQFKYIYPQIKQQQTYIEQVVKSEEEVFLKTLTTGLQRLDHLSANLQQQNIKVIDGAIIFELYDTYGFPPDLTRLIAQERGLQIDEEGFQQALQAQRARSQQAATVEQSEWNILVDSSTPAFVGYDQLETSTHIVQYRSANEKEQKFYHIVLDKTPFYPEGGGQVGDTGQLIIGNQVIPVFDTQKEFERIIHYTYQLPEDLTATVKAVVDVKKRELIANNHTATHLLHATLRQVLGAHVEQKGSLVKDQLLRFDFSHYSKVTPEQIQTIEHIVNQKIRTNIALEETRSIPFKDAKALGVTALFGEKYGEHVRMITFASFSKELCGGTHAVNTGKLGFFKIMGESGVAAGTRRIEAVTAEAAEAFVDTQSNILHQVAESLKNPKEVFKAVQQLLEEKAGLEKRLQAYQIQEIKATIQSLRQRIQLLRGISTLIEMVSLPTVDALKQAAFSFKENQKSLFVTLTAIIDQQIHIVVFISEDLVKTTTLNANNIVKELAKLIQGGGGGQSFLAMAKGNDTSKLQEVLTAAQCIVEGQIVQPTLPS